MARKQVPAQHDWALENAGDDLRTEREATQGEILQAERDAGYVRFVDFVAGLPDMPPGAAYDVVYDFVGDDRWRQIDVHVDTGNPYTDGYLSVWLPPTLAGMYPPDMDVPF